MAKAGVASLWGGAIVAGKAPWGDDRNLKPEGRWESAAERAWWGAGWWGIGRRLFQVEGTSFCTSRGLAVKEEV